MNKRHLILPSLALGGAALLLGPQPTSEGYTLIGGSLGTAQRDFRIFNNFTDASANDNQVPDPQFPGHQGAVMAIWKASVEWGSELHGTGAGDPTQPGGLGSGGANFDASFQGEANGVGGTNNNIHSEIAGSEGGVLAYCETPISDGWRIRYYSAWTWSDGPAAPSSFFADLQGIACHEYGHALGLGHSGASGATMAPFITGSGASQRSIATDDINGVRAIYGVKSAAKPRITGVSVVGMNLTITGTNFHASSNEVWFTNKNVTGTTIDPPVKVTGVSSTGGTSITVPVPADAGPGDVMVKLPTTGNASLSNAYPVDVTGQPGGGGFEITSIVPSTIDALNVGPSQIVTINGSGFTPATILEVNGQPLFGLPSPYTVVSGSVITFDPPNAPFLGSVTVTVKEGAASDSGTLTYVANDLPALQAGDGDEPVSFFSFGGLALTFASHPGDIHVLLASFSDTPSSLPGWFDLEIGNNFANIFMIAQPAIGAGGLATLNLPASLPPLTTFHVQSVRVDPGLTLPLDASNKQECMLLF